MKFLKIIDRLLFLRRCAACREPLSENETVLCSACLAKWTLAKERICYKCHRRAVDCACRPYNIGKSNIVQYRSLVKFQSAVAKPVIYAMKRQNSKELYSFLASQLAETVWKHPGFSRENTVICHCPRKIANLRRYGVDQAELLADALGDILDTDVLCALKSRSHRAQKKLGARARYANAAKSYSLTRDARVEGKNVILIDDIVTTGATAEACAALLKSAGAENILFLSVAKTDRRYRKRYKKSGVTAPGAKMY